MDLRSLYEMIDGNYEDVKDRLVKDSRIVKYVSKFPDDDSYRRLVDAMCVQKTTSRPLFMLIL